MASNIARCRRGTIAWSPVGRRNGRTDAGRRYQGHQRNVIWTKQHRCRPFRATSTLSCQHEAVLDTVLVERLAEELGIALAFGVPNIFQRADAGGHADVLATFALVLSLGHRHKVVKGPHHRLAAQALETIAGVIRESHLAKFAVAHMSIPCAFCLPTT